MRFESGADARGERHEIQLELHVGQRDRISRRASRTAEREHRQREDNLMTAAEACGFHWIPYGSATRCEMLVLPESQFTCMRSALLTEPETPAVDGNELNTVTLLPGPRSPRIVAPSRLPTLFKELPIT